MTKAKRIKLLETALIKYIEMYGFTEEARICFDLKATPVRRPALQAFRDFFRDPDSA